VTTPTGRRPGLADQGPVSSCSGIPVQRCRDNAGEDNTMGKPQPGRWAPIDYLAACSRVVDVVIRWYLHSGAAPRRVPLRKKVTRAWRGPVK
jgi:hypothetical protein